MNVNGSSPELWICRWGEGPRRGCNCRTARHGSPGSMTWQRIPWPHVGVRTHARQLARNRHEAVLQPSTLARCAPAVHSAARWAPAAAAPPPALQAPPHVPLPPLLPPPPPPAAAAPRASRALASLPLQDNKEKKRGVLNTIEQGRVSAAAPLALHARATTAPRGKEGSGLAARQGSTGPHHRPALCTCSLVSFPHKRRSRPWAYPDQRARAARAP